jgi:hypothetical protein
MFRKKDKMKLIKDTLKSPDGKWSRKSLTALVAFINAIALGWIIVIAPKGTINIYAISVFYGFLGLGGGALALTVVDKIKNKGIA